LSQSGYLFLGLTAIVAALSGVLAYAVLRIFAAARAATRDERRSGTETAFMAAAMEDAVRLSQESATSQKQRVYVAGGLFLAIEYATIVKGGRAEDLDFF